MKKLLSTVILSLFVILVYGQDVDPQLCGTPSYRSDWLKKYQANPKAYDLKSAEIINVPITVNRLAENHGNGRMRATNVLRALCTLQQDFEDSDIEFYLKSPIRDIDDNDFFDHETVVDGGLKMFEYNEDGAINCYLVRDAAGNCGYNLPWAGVAVQESCARPEDHTWAHEMGHALKLPHPFLGWEGGISHDNSQAHQYDNPAPEFVLYNYTNFKDSLILDTMIIDTSWVEKMDGSNCNEAADGFCDTKPDYLYQRWPCTNDSISFTEQTDPNGVKFNSDASLIMSYAFDNCAARFTDEQIGAMRANALDEKGDFTSTGMVFPDPVDPLSIELNYPIEDEVVFFRDVEFGWEESQEDQFYLFQVGVEPSFSLVLYDTIVDSPSLTWHEADISWGRLYWRVRPFTANQFCTEYSTSGQFLPSETSSVKEEIRQDLTLFPNLIENNIPEVYLRNSDGRFDQSRFRCLDINGRIISSGRVAFDKISLEQGKLMSGIYFIQIDNGAAPINFKLVVI
ncbi:MAG: hypothetical protein HKN09_04830 [Saprospiraceae bacterium]|nr:hypothetical protein [Saprospiraceae bacterium]